MFRNSLSLFAVLALLSGCVTYTRLPKGRITSIPGSSVVVQEPELGATVRANIGDTMTLAFPGIKHEAIVLDAAHSHTTTNLNQEITLTLPAGQYYLEGQDSRGKFYRSVANITLHSRGDQVSLVGGLIVPGKVDLPPHVYWIATDDPTLYLSSPTQPVPYTKSTYSEKPKGKLRQELIYNGVAQGQVKILYKEFVDDFARPAFDQEVKYDYNPGTEIGFKNVRLTVIRATSTEVDFKLTHGFLQ